MKINGLIVSAIAGALLLSSCSSGGGQTAIKIGDTNITEGTVKFVSEQLIGSDDLQDAVDLLKNDYLVIEVAKAMGIELDEDEEDAAFDQAASMKAQYFGGYKAAKNVSKEYGADENVLNSIVTASSYAQKLLDQLDTAEATDDEKKQYFKDNYLRAKHVLISTVDQNTGAPLSDEEAAKAKTTADEVLAKAKNGENFDALINEYNTDPGMSTNPDGYVFTHGTMVSEFEDMTKSLQPGEIGMCETTYGYHIIQRLALDETPELFDKFYNDNLTSIENTIQNKKYDEALEAKAEELGITVEVNQDVIDAMAEEEASEATEEPAAEAEATAAAE